MSAVPAHRLPDPDRFAHELLELADAGEVDLAELEQREEFDGHPFERRLGICEAPDIALRPTQSIEEVRLMMREKAREYLALENPLHALVLKVPPGTGKTTMAVEIAEWLAEQERWTLYVGPRHDFYQDIQRLANRPELWYEWLPRQDENEAKNKVRTCNYTVGMQQWLNRGWQAMDFCVGVCEHDGIKRCVYHQQKAKAQGKIVFGQHMHATVGHPLEFQVLIGDESPLAAFCHEWTIPAAWVLTEDLDPNEPVGAIMLRLKAIALTGGHWEGPTLLEELYGAEYVAEALRDYEMPVYEAPWISFANDAEKKPWGHLWATLRLLLREAEAAMNGKDYPHRVIVDGGNLLLLLRRKVNERLPRHIIWLDATANSHLYETILGRPVEVIEPNLERQGRVYQVYDRSNGMGSLLKHGKPTEGADQLIRQIEQIRSLYGGKVAVITHMGLEDEIRRRTGIITGHYFGERGTNRYENVEALIVAGTPMPPLPNIDRTARMIYHERMKAFGASPRAKDAGSEATLPWFIDWRAYNFIGPDGLGRKYPAGGFWHEGDGDLQAILHQHREAELIQAVHRARPNLRSVDVWLLSNLPVEEIPPTDLIPMAALFGAPEGVPIWQWAKVSALLDERFELGQPVWTPDLTRAGVSKNSSTKLIERLGKVFPDVWELRKLKRQGARGQPSWALIPRPGPKPEHGLIRVAGRTYRPIRDEFQD